MESPVIGVMFRSLYEFSVCNSSINFYVGRSPTKNEYWHTFLSHGIQQFNHHGIVHCKIERFSDLFLQGHGLLIKLFLSVALLSTEPLFPHWWLSISFLRATILLHICGFFALHIQFLWHLFLGKVLSCCWIIVSFFLHVVHTARSFNGHQFCYQWTNEFWGRCYPRWLLEVFHMVCHEDSLSISESPYGIQKEEIVVTNAYPTFAQHVDQLITSRHSMDHHSQVNRN